MHTNSLFVPVFAVTLWMLLCGPVITLSLGWPSNGAANVVPDQPSLSCACMSRLPSTSPGCAPQPPGVNPHPAWSHSSAHFGVVLSQLSSLAQSLLGSSHLAGKRAACPELVHAEAGFSWSFIPPGSTELLLCSSPGTPLSQRAFPHGSVSVLAWPSTPAPSLCSPQSPEPVVLPCRLRGLWCPKTTGRQSQGDPF